MRRLSIASLLLPLALAGCLGVPRPAPVKLAGSDAGWITPGAPGAVEENWWAALRDPRLDALVADALKASPDLAEAEAHLAAARAQSRGAAAPQLPAVNASAAASRSRQTLDGLIPLGRIPGFARDNTLFDVGFDASWELDFWGAVRSSAAAARARAQVAQARAAGTRLQVVAEVARDYATLRTAHARRASLASEARFQAALVSLHQQRLAMGEAGRDPLLAAQQRLEGLNAALPALDSQIRSLAFALGVLTARAPEAMLMLADQPAPPPAAPAQVALGLRSELLLRRPDVRLAQADYAAASADTGVARAALFPRLTLAGSLGQQARDGLDLTSLASTHFSAGPSLSWPIYAAGRLKAQLAGTRAEARAAGDRYQKAVLGALADSEGAANRFAQAQASAARQQAALGQAREVAGLVAQRAARGEDSRLDLLAAQAAAEAARQAAILADADTLDAYVALCKALGGGWSPEGTMVQEPH